MGKTLYVTRMKEKLQAVTPRHNSLITIPVHGPIVTVDSMIERLVQNEDSCDYSILHFDIPPSVC